MTVSLDFDDDVDFVEPDGSSSCDVSDAEVDWVFASGCVEDREGFD